MSSDTHIRLANSAVTGPGDQNATSSKEGDVLTYNVYSVYAKGVTARVDARALKCALSRYGKIDYYDVYRSKVQCSLF